MNYPIFGLSLLLGCRHGIDPDHLAAIDGLSQMRLSPWNGVLFALGHGLVVTLFAAGIGSLSLSWLEPIAPWLLVFIGTFNLFRLFRRGGHTHQYALATSSPILVGIIFAAGFETASQLSALTLVHRDNAWLVGATFSAGMVLVDGIDGYNAFLVRRRGRANSAHAVRISNYLSALVVFSSYALAAAEFGNVNVERYGLIVGMLLFLAVFSLRLWSRLSEPKSAAK